MKAPAARFAANATMQCRYNRNCLNHVELTPLGFESASVQSASFTQKIAALFRDLSEEDQHEL
jgi:hypothetical protein